MLAPTAPSKVVAVAMNYLDNLPDREAKLPEEPIFFLKPPSSVIGTSDQIIYPSRVGQLDYEAELAVVMGSRARDVSKERAKDYVLGYTCGNDVTARDLQRKDYPLALCKSFDSFCPLGPVVVTDLDTRCLKIQLRVNGEIRQSSTTDKMIFDPLYLVSYISTVMTLEEGDVILTGTPSGVGPMQVGDNVEVEIQGIGILSNYVTAQSGCDMRG